MPRAKKNYEDYVQMGRQNGLIYQGLLPNDQSTTGVPEKTSQKCLWYDSVIGEEVSMSYRTLSQRLTKGNPWYKKSLAIKEEMLPKYQARARALGIDWREQDNEGFPRTTHTPTNWRSTSGKLVRGVTYNSISYGNLKRNRGIREKLEIDLEIVRAS